jgi:uncharacterized cupredoxin-like copper-binding protein
MKKFSLVPGLILLIGLLLTACGSSSSSGSGHSINVTMSDFKFEPETVNVAAGKPVTVTLKNTGSVQHTWSVMSNPVNGSYSDADKASILFSSDTVAPGGEKKVNFTAPTTPGDYQIICTEPGHLEAGMVGHLMVK